METEICASFARGVDVLCSGLLFAQSLDMCKLCAFLDLCITCQLCKMFMPWAFACAISQRKFPQPNLPLDQSRGNKEGHSWETLARRNQSELMSPTFRQWLWQRSSRTRLVFLRSLLALCSLNRGLLVGDISIRTIDLFNPRFNPQFVKFLLPKTSLPYS